jgi:hypothetical protein
MPRRVSEEDDWDDEDVRDGDDEYETDSFDNDEPTVPCPNCQREIHEDSPCCPHCGSYVSREDQPPASKPWWIIIGTLACLYVIYRWIAG